MKTINEARESLTQLLKQLDSDAQKIREALKHLNEIKEETAEPLPSEPKSVKVKKIKPRVAYMGGKVKEAAIEEIMNVMEASGTGLNLKDIEEQVYDHYNHHIELSTLNRLLLQLVKDRKLSSKRAGTSNVYFKPISHV